MRAIVLMFDSLNRHVLPPFEETVVEALNFERLAERTITSENFHAGSMPCMPARSRRRNRPRHSSSPRPRVHGSPRGTDRR